MKQLSPANRVANMGVSEGLASTLCSEVEQLQKVWESICMHVSVCVCIIYSSFVLWESCGDSLTISYQDVLIGLSEFL